VRRLLPYRGAGSFPSHEGRAVTEQQCLTFLKDEYLQLERSIEEFDGRALTIKAWSVTFSMVALVGSFAAHAPVGFLIAVFGSCLFWWIECMWKTFQYAFYERINLLEDFFAGKAKRPAPFQIGRSWYCRWSGLGFKKMCCILCWPRVALPHAAVVFLGVTLFVLTVAGVIRP
jgi:hypothetical protein